MRATITRRLTRNTISGYKIVKVDGKPTVEEVTPVTLYGNITENDAKRELEKVYGKDTRITVGEIVTEDVQYEISVDDFVKYAKVVGAKTDETATTENN